MYCIAIFVLDASTVSGKSKRAFSKGRNSSPELRESARGGKRSGVHRKLNPSKRMSLSKRGKLHGQRHPRPRKAMPFIPLIPKLTIPPPGVDPIFIVHTFATTLLPFKWAAPLIAMNVSPPIKNGDLNIKLPRIKNPVVIDEFPTYQTLDQPPSNYITPTGSLMRFACRSKCISAQKSASNLIVFKYEICSDDLSI